MFEFMNWLIIIPVLAFLIFVHELGHFATAKLFKIKVLEFGFGFPPRIFGYTYKGTIYSVNLIPVGGFVKMAGEKEFEGPGSFSSANPFQRLVVLIAGSFMNLVIPFLIFMISFMMPHQSLAGGEVIINAVVPGSPAFDAGMETGDVIVKVNDDRINDLNQLLKIINDNLGQETDITLKKNTMVAGLNSERNEGMVLENISLIPRKNPPVLDVVEEVTDQTAKFVDLNSEFELKLQKDGSFSYDSSSKIADKALVGDKQISVKAAKTYDATFEAGDKLNQGSIGILIGISNPRFVSQQSSFFDSITQSYSTITGIFVLTWESLYQAVSSRSNPGFVGPIGMAQITAEGVSRMGPSWIFQLAAFISLNLAIVNMLPIPALDGGRVLFIIVELVRGGRKVSEKIENAAHIVGFLALMGLILLMSFVDFTRIISGESLF